MAEDAVNEAISSKSIQNHCPGPFYMIRGQNWLHVFCTGRPDEVGGEKLTAIGNWIARLPPCGYVLGVYTRPDDLTDGQIVAELAAGWGFHAEACTYLPVGFGSHHWLATDAVGHQLFLVAHDLPSMLQSQTDTAEAAFGRLAGVRSARTLRDPRCRRRASQPVGRVLCARLRGPGGHPSRTAVAGSLVRSTREHRAGRPQTLAQDPRALARIPLLTLLRVGFTKPLGSPRALVVSYTTVSPLPPAGAGGGLFSVALSRGSPRVGVTDHPALRSPDLPRHARRTWRDAAARPTRPPLPSSLGGRAGRGECAGARSHARAAPPPGTPKADGAASMWRTPPASARAAGVRLADQATQETAVALAVALLRRARQRQIRHRGTAGARPAGSRAAG